MYLKTDKHWNNMEINFIHLFIKIVIIFKPKFLNSKFIFGKMALCTIGGIPLKLIRIFFQITFLYLFTRKNILYFV